MRPLQNLHLLKKDMEEKGWIIDSFRFPFNNVNYIVLVILYEPGEQKKQFALVKLDFLHPENFKNHLLVPTNAVGLMAEAMVLRKFFRIKEYEKLGDALRYLTNQIGSCIPTKVCNTKSDPEQKAMIYSLSCSDSEDPEKIYCYAVRRNPKVLDKKTGELIQRKRTPYNDNKTRLRRESLYQLLGNEDTISFCYSNDPKLDYPDEVIMDNWVKNKEKEQALQLI